MQTPLKAAKCSWLAVILTFVFYNSAGAQASKIRPDRLLSLARTYATVKYFYPNAYIARHNFDWNEFALYLFQRSQSAQTDNEFAKKLTSDLQIVAPGISLFAVDDSTLIKPIIESHNDDTDLTFWQYKTAINKPDGKSKLSLAYLYKYPLDYHSMIQVFAPKPLHLNGKRIRLSIWAKLLSSIDSALICSLSPYDIHNHRRYPFPPRLFAKTDKWEKYSIEYDYPDSAVLDRVYMESPRTGALYVDDLKLEYYENSVWHEVGLKNSSFEAYSSKKIPIGWELEYIASNKTCKILHDYVIDGKSALCLYAIEDSVLYNVSANGDKVKISLPGGQYLTLPLKQPIEVIAKSNMLDQFQTLSYMLRQNRGNDSDEERAIALTLDIYAILLCDYPYGSALFQKRMDTLLINTVNAITCRRYRNPYHAVLYDFVVWVNDPHLHFDYKAQRKYPSLDIRIPFSLEGNRCIVTGKLDSKLNIDKGDVITSFDHIKFDSLINEWDKQHISKYVQSLAIKLMLSTTAFDSAVVETQNLTGNPTVTIIRERTNVRNVEISDQSINSTTAARLESNGILYLDFTKKDMWSDNSAMKTRDQYMDSIIEEINKYKSVIIDIRSRPVTSTMSFFSLHIKKINPNVPYDIEKVAFYPDGKFKFDTVFYTTIDHRLPFVKAKIYFLINSQTISDPERLLVRFKDANCATFIGTSTAGAAGSTNKLEAHKDCLITYTANKVCYYSSKSLTSYQGTGIPPDIAVFPTPQGIKNMVDEVLERAITEAAKN